MRNPIQKSFFVLWPDSQGVMRRQTVNRVQSNMLGFRAFYGTRCFRKMNAVFEELTAHSIKEADMWMDSPDKELFPLETPQQTT